MAPHTNPLASTGLDQPPGHTSLCILLQTISSLVEDHFTVARWFSAEISQLKEIKGGHVAIELVEHDTQGKLIARAQCFIWRGKSDKVIAKFKLATGSELSAGMKVLFSAKPEFSAAYGLRLIIDNIDPSYTLGDIQAKLKQIRLALAKEGIFSNNKSLAEPFDFCKVAVISPNAAAGLGDFKADADLLEQSGLCSFNYFSCVFQGIDAAREIRNCLDNISTGDLDYDAVCIIRGGGSVTDLYWLNDLELARDICTCAFPVFTGIGHERDNTILDEVANSRFDTPSKIIAHIRQTICINAWTAGAAYDEIKTHLSRQLTSAENGSKAMIASIENLANNQLQQAESQADQYAASLIPKALNILSEQEIILNKGISWIEAKAVSLLSKADSEVEAFRQQVIYDTEKLIQDAERETAFYHRAILENAQAALGAAERDVEALAREILVVGPEATLKRGFAIVRDAATGDPIVSTEQAKSLDKLNLQFKDGELLVKPEY